MTAEEHRRIGKLLGFPDCCVEYWINDSTGAAIRRGAIYGPWRTEEEIAQLIEAGVPRKIFYNPVNGRLEDARQKYVPCPSCVGGPNWRPWKTP